MKLHFILREIWFNRGQAAILVLCAALSVVSLVSLNSFRRDVYGTLLADARSLNGGDIIVSSARPFSTGLDSLVTELDNKEGVETTRVYEFYSVVRAKKKPATLLASIRAVASNYPLYGEVVLASGRPLTEVLRPGTALVAQNVLDRLGLALGDRVLVGNAELEIAGIVAKESGRPGDLLSFGPRIFVTNEDLPAMGLIQYGSRVSYLGLLKIHGEQNLEYLQQRLGEQAVSEEQVVAARDADSRVKRFFDNLLFFLSLVSIFTLLLAGIGIQSGLTALIRRRIKSLAVLRTLGASGTFLISHFLFLTFLLTLAGGLLGVAAGLGAKSIVITFLIDLFPKELSLGIHLLDVLEGIGLALLVSVFFTFMPLRTILEIKPAQVFREEEAKRERPGLVWLFRLGCVLLLFALVARILDDPQIGLLLVGGFLLLLIVLALQASFFLALLQKTTGRSLVLRQALRSLLRPGNATRSIIVTLAAAIAVLVCINLIEKNLRANFITAYPDGAPNLFCLDIQKDQKEAFARLVGENEPLFPVIRARLTAINGREIDRQKERKRRGDSLTREFNLTYRGHLLPDEKIIAGASLFGEPQEGVVKNEDRGLLVPVSVLDSVAAMGGMELYDRLSFSIQGVPLTAEIVSIRSRTKSMLYPFFYFVFPGKTLEAAPATYFAALSRPQTDLGALENTIVSQFPNVSTINVSQMAVELGGLMTRLAAIVDFFALFSIGSGSLILVSSILATRLARAREGAYYKIMGADWRFVGKIFLVENALLGLASSLAALLVAQPASWAVCRFVFDLDYVFFWWDCLAVALLVTALVSLLGLLASLAVIFERPARFLRSLIA